MFHVQLAHRCISEAGYVKMTDEYDCNQSIDRRWQNYQSIIINDHQYYLRDFNGCRKKNNKYLRIKNSWCIHFFELVLLVIGKQNTNIGQKNVETLGKRRKEPQGLPTIWYISAPASDICFLQHCFSWNISDEFYGNPPVRFGDFFLDVIQIWCSCLSDANNT